MLSEHVIDYFIGIIAARQEAINNYIIKQIAKKIKEIGELSSSDSYKLERILQTGGDVKKINAEIARLTGLQEREIKKILKTVAKSAYTDTKAFYDYRYKPFIPFEKNIPLQRRLQAIARVTLEEYVNLSKSRATGFLIRDLKNPGKLKFQSIEETYKSIIDEAVQATQSGIIDYGTAMRKTLTQLVNSGVRKISWDSGYTQRLDTAVKRNILEGIKAINQEVQNVTGEQYGADGKEITVHAYSAPDHEPVQGHQFSNEEWEKLQSNQPFMDVKGNEFDPIERAIGTLNCRHFAYSIIIGVSKPIYTDEQLEKFKEDNAKGYNLPNGKHLTMYECTQYQRSMESRIRKLKDAQMAAQTAGDMPLARKLQSKVTRLTAEYKAFSKACGLSAQMQNLSVSGYKRISSK